MHFLLFIVYLGITQVVPNMQEDTYRAVALYVYDYYRNMLAGPPPMTPEIMIQMNIILPPVQVIMIIYTRIYIYIYIYMGCVTLSTV